VFYLQRNLHSQHVTDDSCWFSLIKKYKLRSLNCKYCVTVWNVRRPNRTRRDIRLELGPLTNNLFLILRRPRNPRNKNTRNIKFVTLKKSLFMFPSLLLLMTLAIWDLNLQVLRTSCLWKFRLETKTRKTTWDWRFLQNLFQQIYKRAAPTKKACNTLVMI
jgi:hypothetical protein